MKFFLHDVIHTTTVFTHEMNVMGSKFTEHIALSDFKINRLLKWRFLLSLQKDAVMSFLKYNSTSILMLKDRNRLLSDKFMKSYFCVV